MLKRQGRFMRSLVVAALVATGLVGGAASPVSASPASWDRSLSAFNSLATLTHADGSVSVSGASPSEPNAIQTVDAQNNSVVSVANSGSPMPAPSYLLWEVGGDNTIFAPAYQVVGQNAQNYLAAYRAGAEVWHVLPPDTCANQLENIYALELGANGMLYMVSGRSFGCTGQEFFLSGINPQDGGVAFSLSLGGSFFVSPTGLLAYNNGVAVLSAAPYRLRYYTNVGTLVSETALSLASGYWPGTPTITYDGRVYLAVSHYSATWQECPYPWTSVSEYIAAFEPDGAVLDANNDPLRYMVQPCAVVAGVNVMPNGGLVATVRAYNLDDRLLALDADLGGVWDAVFDTATVGGREFMPWLGHDVKADNNGNIVTVSWYWRDNQKYRGAQVKVLGGTNGVVRSVFYTDQINSAVSFGVTSDGISLAEGRLYLAAHTCGSYMCSGSSGAQAHVYAVPVSGLGMDYPRARMLGQMPGSVTARKYVALGDSFSSGEGVEPFMAPSDANGCHRSTFAYAKLLDEAPGLNLSLSGFAACSGATTYDVANGKSGEDPQLDALSTGVDIVTVTIGGNDASFSAFVMECFNPTPGVHCDSSTQYASTMDKVQNELPGKLDDLFEAIKLRVGQGARILVLGYPRMMPYTMGEFPNCWYLSSEERLAASDVTNGLNATTRGAVTRAGAQFEFVDADANLYGVRISPFAGHELCAEGAYFNDISWPMEYSMHPNRAGQQAYATLVEDYLLTHP